MEIAKPYINQHNRKMFYLWLKRDKKFDEGKIKMIFSYINVIDNYIYENFASISSIYFVNNSNELEHIKKSFISSEAYKAMNMAASLFMLEVLNQYSNFVAKNASKLQPKQRTIDTEIKTKNLSTELIGNQFQPFIYALRDEGIYTVEQFRAKFKKESLLHYLNKRDQYSWKERMKIVESVSELLEKNIKKTTNSSTTKNACQKQEPSEYVEQYFTINFNENRSYAYTKPKELIICGNRTIVNCWTELLVALCDCLMKKNKKITRSLLEEPLFPSSSRPYFSNTNKNLKEPKQLENGMWVETNFNADSIVEICKVLCNRFNVPLDEVIIRYYSYKGFNGKLERDKGRNIKAKDANDGITAQIEEFIKSRGLFECSLDEVITGLRQPSRMRTSIIQALESNPRIIEMARGKYIHRDSIVDLDEAGECILNILKMHFRQFDGYSNCRLLFDAVRIELPLFVNDNAFEDEVTIYAIAKHLFSKECFGGNRFVFYNNTHIWEKEPDYPKSIRGLLMQRARLNGGTISRSESVMFLERIKMGLGNFQQAIQSDNDSTFYQYAPGKYVLSEVLHIDKDWLERVKKALDRLFAEKEFVIPRDIVPTWYEQLPELPTGVNWTPLLLQEVLAYNPEIGYKAVFAPLEQRKDTVAAAIVLENSELSFADVVSEFLNSTIELPQRMGAEDLRLILKKAGMIEGNELIYNMHKALDDYRFAWSDNDKTVYINKG